MREEDANGQSPIRAVLYTRISNDPTHQGLGVERQELDCRATAERYGWTVVGTYEDNDKSATNGKARPEFARMVKDFKAGHFDAVVAWNLDRLTRDVIEGEQIIRLAQEHGLRVANVTGESHLTTADGRENFRWKVVGARAETERTSERLRRQRDQAAEQGRPHGMVAYGYRRVVDTNDRGQILGKRDVLNPAEADLIRETAQRLFAGESLRSIVRTHNEAGRPSPRGIPWSSTALRQVMLRDRNAGLRVHRGKVVGKAAWPPIYDEGTHNRVKALLTDPSRAATGRGAPVKHLLSGLAKCGLCGEAMRAMAPGRWAGKRFPAKYQCATCFRVARSEDRVDEVVTSVVVARLSEPDGILALASGRPERAAQLLDQIAEAEARLELAADGFAEGSVTSDQLRRIGARINPQIEAWKVELAGCAPMEGVIHLAGPDAAEKWQAAPLDVKRAVINLLMEITILPSGSGNKFDPSQVRIEWRHG